MAIIDTSNPIIERTGSNAVTYDLSQPHQTTITLPVGSAWSSELHWHETHNEYLQVIQGAIRVRLGGKTRVLRAGEEAKVAKFVRHEWSRADVSGGEEVVVIERTEPADVQKHLFFWNINGVILENQSAKSSGWFGELLTMLRIFLIFYKLDNWPVICDLSPFRMLLGEQTTNFEVGITHFLLATGAFLARILGYKAVDATFTPPQLLHGYEVHVKLINGRRLQVERSISSGYSAMPCSAL